MNNSTTKHYTMKVIIPILITAQWNYLNLPYMTLYAYCCVHCITLTIPIQEHEFALHKAAFHDAVALRYGWMH